jgi:hypothetical protein
MILFSYLSRVKDNNLNSIVLTVNLINIDGHIDLNEKSFNKSFKKPITLVFNFLEVIFFI